MARPGCVANRPPDRRVVHIAVGAPDKAGPHRLGHLVIDEIQRHTAPVRRARSKLDRLGLQTLNGGNSREVVEADAWRVRQHSAEIGGAIWRIIDADVVAACQRFRVAVRAQRAGQKHARDDHAEDDEAEHRDRQAGPCADAGLES